MASSTRRRRRCAYIPLSHLCCGKKCLPPRLANQQAECFPLHPRPPVLKGRLLLDSRYVTLVSFTVPMGYALTARVYRETERTMDHSNLVCYRHHYLDGDRVYLWLVIQFEKVPTVRKPYTTTMLSVLTCHRRSFVMAAAMFMNSNALPIALMQSLVVSVPDLAWGTDDNKNAMLGRALTYLTMYSTLGMVVSLFFMSCLLHPIDSFPL
jgi:hypothetical protein